MKTILLAPVDPNYVVPARVWLFLHFQHDASPSQVLWPASGPPTRLTNYMRPHGLDLLAPASCTNIVAC